MVDELGSGVIIGFLIGVLVFLIGMVLVSIWVDDTMGVYNEQDFKCSKQYIHTNRTIYTNDFKKCQASEPIEYLGVLDMRCSS